jgi:hypothetical protein
MEAYRAAIFSNLLVGPRETHILTFIMDELVNLVVQKTGLSQEDAQKAVQAVIDVLKSKLPAPIAAQIDVFLTGGATGEVNALESEAGNVLKGELGGLLGKL